MAALIRWVAAIELSGAAGIHFAVVGVHFAEWSGFGMFFLGAAYLQVALALALGAGADDRLYFLAAATQLALVAVWITSRTTGLPVGPQPWIPERVGVADTVASAFELMAAVAYLALPWTRDSARVSRRDATVIIGLCALSVGVLTGLALVGPYLGRR